jgi:hypothetical protein
MVDQNVQGQIAAGLYTSKGYAQDTFNRLKTEGVSELDIALVVLREIAPVPATSEPELAALSVDPLVLGNVRKTFARFIRNGETAVLVNVPTIEDAQFVTGIMLLYAPVTVEILQAGATAPTE